MGIGKIKKVSGVEIKDSTGRPTLKIVLESENYSVEALVPSGQSAGSREAVELRDGDLGMEKALEILENEIKPVITGKNLIQKEIDETLISLDGTENKARLGGNTMIGISIATAKLVAKEMNVPLWKSIALENESTIKFPNLYMNIINGGVHADFRLPFQEYMIVVHEKKVSDSYKTGQRIFEKLGEIIKEKFGEVPFGDEGGYSPVCQKIEEPFELLNEVCVKEENVFFAIDAAASEFLKNDEYKILKKKYSSEDLFEIYSGLSSKFNLKSIEDPFGEGSWDDFKKITAQLGQNVIIVGDDLTVTNPKIISEAIEFKAANAVIIKPNQVGTLTETFETVRLAHKAGWKTIVSHRSGDTMDSFIADLAVGLGVYGIKAGSPYPPERRAKYERLVEIEQNEMD